MRNNEEIEVKVTLTEMPQEDKQSEENSKNGKYQQFKEDDDFSVFDFFR